MTKETMQNNKENQGTLEDGEEVVSHGTEDSSGQEMPQMPQNGVSTEAEIGSEDWIEKALAETRVNAFVRGQAWSEERKEQERTQRKKELFLEIYAKTMGTITVACEKADIDRKTFYRWKEADGEFAAKLIDIERQRVDMAEDRVFKLIQQDDGPTVRWWLERTTDKYKSRKVLEHHTDDKTFEDVVDELLDIMDGRKEHPKQKDNEKPATPEN